jgi:hypothetical protein
MPRRDRRDSYKPHTEQELAALRKTLAAMDDSKLIGYYKATYRVCEWRDRLPNAQFIQELVALWKELRSRVKRGSKKG